jgi:ATP-dependent helicase/nuclease subunit A
MIWTPEQERAIYARGCDLIVSAAAGSGKTAVLVERICRLIVSGEASLDALIVCTFTKAATAEMRGRIERRLREQVAQDAARAEALRAQLDRLDGARIGTLHSVCAWLLRQYHYAAGVDPGFRIEDETLTGAQLRQAAEDALEEAFEAGDADFLAFARCWGDRIGASLPQLVCDVYQFVRNYPRYLDWLSEAVERLGQPYATLKDTPWSGEFARAAAQALDTAALLVGEALALATACGAAGYKAVLQAEHDALQILTKDGSDRIQSIEIATAQVNAGHPRKGRPLY